MDSGLNSIKKLFDALVSLIMAVFGFLPDWCIVFIGTAFVFVVAVFVYKLVRG